MLFLLSFAKWNGDEFSYECGAFRPFYSGAFKQILAIDKSSRLGGGESSVMVDWINTWTHIRLIQWLIWWHAESKYESSRNHDCQIGICALASIAWVGNGLGDYLRLLNSASERTLGNFSEGDKNYWKPTSYSLKCAQFTKADLLSPISSRRIEEFWGSRNSLKRLFLGNLNGMGNFLVFWTNSWGTRCRCVSFCDKNTWYYFFYFINELGEFVFKTLMDMLQVDGIFVNSFAWSRTRKYPIKNKPFLLFLRYSFYWSSHN